MIYRLLHNPGILSFMRPSESLLRQILEKANWSPSGDNCQPWTYEWNGERLVIFHDADRAEHPVNPGGTASKIALGCLLEAMDISASEFGFKTLPTLLELKSEGIAPWAEVQFQPSEAGRNPLSDSLLKRTTDRRPFQGGDLREDLFQKLEHGPAKLHLLAHPEAEFVQYVVESEQLLTDHPHILPATMKWARLSAKHAQSTQDGLSWRNLGAKFWEVPMMPLIRDFRPFFLFARHTIAPQHRVRVTKQLTSAAGVVCVSVTNKTDESIVAAGRLMMNAWLSLTHQGHGVQPLTLASMVNMCSIDGIMPLSNKWQKFHREGQNTLRKHLSISTDSTPVWMIRTGISTPLPENCKTLRKPPQVKMTGGSSVK